MAVLEDLKQLAAHFDEGGDGVSFDIAGIAKAAIVQIEQLRKVEDFYPGQTLYAIAEYNGAPTIHKWGVEFVCKGENGLLLKIRGGGNIPSTRVGKNVFLSEAEAKRKAGIYK